MAALHEGNVAPSIPRGRPSPDVGHVWARSHGWRQAFGDMGLVADGDFPADEPMIILSVFGGYCYINASYVRMLGVRAPGGSVEVIDQQFFGESDAPDYVARDGDKNLKTSAKLAKTVSAPSAQVSPNSGATDKVAVQEALTRRSSQPAGATEQELADYLHLVQAAFPALFQRHIENTFSVALVSGALADLCVKVDKALARIVARRHWRCGVELRRPRQCGRCLDPPWPHRRSMRRSMTASADCSNAWNRCRRPTNGSASSPRSLPSSAAVAPTNGTSDPTHGSSAPSAPSPPSIHAQCRRFHQPATREAPFAAERGCNGARCTQHR
ncbi:MAG: hypothetical protein R2706_11975 [Acidimicrobiales bacterium]